MLYKISKTSINVLPEDNSTPDDTELQIHLKKKQNKLNSHVSLSGLAAWHEAVQLPNLAAQGGGLQKVEKRPAEVTTHPYLPAARKLQQDNLGDSLSPHFVQKAASKNGKKVLIVAKDELTPISSSNHDPRAAKNKAQTTTTVSAKVIAKTAADALVNKQQATTTLSAEMIAKAGADAAVNQQPSSKAQNIQTGPLLTSVTIDNSDLEVVVKRHEKPLSEHDELGGLKSSWYPGKQAEWGLSKQVQAEPKSSDSLTMFQRLKAQAEHRSEVKSGKENKMLEVNYQFQRWSGNHSVRVSLQTDVHRKRNITLLPSDIRTADALNQNKNNLQDFNTDIQWSLQDEEQEQRHRQQNSSMDEDPE